MILEQQKQAEVIQQGNIDETIKMSLDMDSVNFLMGMLSKNLYSDAIGSTIRETVSNSLDSHRRAKIKEPIIVSFGNVNGNYEFSTEDFGCGLDNDDVTNIISKYGKSTKRDKADEIGAMGLGFKSPLSYTSNFFFICRKNGVERKYMMYEGEDKNSIDLLYESATTEKNGVKIIVPVNYNDRWSFVEKIKEQLCYFENVYFNVNDIENDFTISRQDDFQYSSLCPDRLMHITLDDVYYSIDWKSLGISSISVPVALRFNLSDGIYPLPNRETLKYTKETIEKIKAKINKVADYFINLHNETVKDCNNPMEIYRSLRNKDYYATIEDKNFNINDLIPYSSIKMLKPKLDGFSLISPEYLLSAKFNSDYILQEYEIVNRIDGGKWKSCNRHHDRKISFSNLNKKIILVSDTVKGVKKEYLKENYNGSGYYNSTLIIKKTNSLKLKKNSTIDRSDYYRLLELYLHPKSEWRARIKEFQKFVKLIIDTWIDGDKIVVPQSFIDARKTVRTKPTYISSGRRVKLSGDISVKKAEKLQRWVDGKNCKWTSELWKIQDIEKHKSLIVWGTEKDVVMMDKLFEILDKYSIKTKITLLLVGERELKNIQLLNIHNLISFDKFMEGKNKPFRRLVTAYLINGLRIKNRNVFEKLNSLSYVSTELAVKLKKLDDYKDNHYNSGSDIIWNAMLEVARENNLWDETIYSEYLEVKSILEKLPFLNTLSSHLGRYQNSSDHPMLQIIIDLCKYHKFKVNSEHYIAKPVEILNEQLLEETV